MIKQPQVGRQHGCNDTGAPETHTAAELSRLLDALYAAQEAGLSVRDAFALAPDTMKLEFNYSNWKYVAA